MARQCAICGKRVMVGNRISHAHNVNKRVFKPNLQKVRVVVDGRARRLRVCTRCIRSGRLRKPGL